MTEYPKVIDVYGLKVTVQDAAEEARWAAARPAGDRPSSSPLADSERPVPSDGTGAEDQVSHDA